MKYNIFKITTPFITLPYIWYCEGDINDKLKEYENEYNDYLCDFEAPYQYVHEYLRYGNHDIQLIQTIECNNENEIIEIIKNMRNKPPVNYKDNFNKLYRKNFLKSI